MSGKKPKGSGFRLLDLFVIILCISGALYSIYLFRNDLFRTLDAHKETSVGTIIVKSNNVQRRLKDKKVWDRLIKGSPVFMGDLIRVARLSAVTLDIDNNHIDLNENTLIRIQSSYDNEDRLIIELTEGSLVLSTGADSGSLMLNIAGREIEAEPGTVLNAAAGIEGIVLQVSEGAASIINEGGRREISSGGMVAIDSAGVEQFLPSVVVTNPRSNARYLKDNPQPLNISFAWNRINLPREETLQLEISMDRSFNRIVRVIDNLDSSAQTELNSGTWYWRLVYLGETLSNGQLVITDTSTLQLLSPVTESVYQYQEEMPNLHFQWTTVDNAEYYIMEASLSPDFLHRQINVQSAAAFFSDSSLGAGTWYWRVMPVFPSVYEGFAAFSQAAVFRIEKIENHEEPEIFIPEPVEEILPEIPQPVPPEIRLTTPLPGVRLPGLTALRQRTEFRWGSDVDLEWSRFVLSRNPNPLSGRPQIEINNPGRIVFLDQLGEGIWYWTIEARSTEGLTAAAQPRQIQVLPIPLLPAPENLLPIREHTIGINELQIARNINFSWLPVPGANGYIFSIFHETTNERRQITSIGPGNFTSWTLDDVRILTRGTFTWQVEAVNIGNTGAIEQRGLIAENTFILNIPSSGTVRIDDTGVLYGN
jgi:hypothetical protein